VLTLTLTQQVASKATVGGKAGEAWREPEGLPGADDLPAAVETENVPPTGMRSGMADAAWSARVQALGEVAEHVRGMGPSTLDPLRAELLLWQVVITRYSFTLTLFCGSQIILAFPLVRGMGPSTLDPLRAELLLWQVVVLTRYSFTLKRFCESNLYCPGAGRGGGACAGHGSVYVRSAAGRAAAMAGG